MEHASRRSEWTRPSFSIADGARRAALLLLVTLFLMPVAMWAQDTATIVGTVTDSTGAVVPGAKVTVSNPDRGFTREVASDSAGAYNAARIPIGNYVVSAEMTGFQKLVRSGIVVDAGQTQRVDLALTVGQVTQEVSVTGNVAKVETENATLGNTVTSKQIQNLTLNGLNFLALTFLVPGAVQDNSQPEAMALGHSGSEVNVSFNGNRIEYSQLEFDGGNNSQESSTGMGGAVVPALDAIAELHISTSNYGADVGQHAGALVETVTKGGTKGLHGSAYEFVRNDKMDANDWFANQEIAPAGGNAPKTPLKWNIFGYSVGGPFEIPKVYNTSRNKTFFFWSQEWAKYRAANFVGGSVPTLKMRNGDFSECDPSSGAYLGGQYPGFTPANCHLPIVNGQAVDQVTAVNGDAAAWLAAYVPLPNNGPLGYANAGSHPTNFSDTIIRVDQNISDKASLFVRFASDTWVNTTVPALWSGSSYDTTESAYSVPARQTVMHFNYNFSPTVMNEFIMSYTDTPHTISTLPGPGSIAKSILKPSDWSASTFFPANASNKLLPANGMGGNVPFGWWVDNGNYVGKYDAEPVFTYRDNLAVIHGKHTIKAGFFLEKFQLTEQFGTETQGIYNFSGGSGPAGFSTGNGLADMFLGDINSYQEGTYNDHGIYTGGYGVGHWRRTDFEPYFQDDWKVTRRLTVNFGVRYYYLIPPHDVTHPTVDSSFEPSLFNPALASVLGPDGNLHKNYATGQIYDFSGFGNGLVECGAGPISKGCQVPYKENIGPRLGFAWDPTGNGKWSIRGGYGIYYEPGNGNDANEIGLEGNAPTTLAPTKPYISGYNFNSGGFAGVGPASIQAIPYYQKNPAVAQYNLNVQHEFKGNNFLTVGYVGNQGRHLDTNQNDNQIRIPVVPSMNVPAQSSGNGGPCDQYGNCDVQNILIHQQTSANYFLPYQGFSAINVKEFDAVSSYNAMQTDFRHTTGYGLTLETVYTWGHTIDNSTSAYASGLPDALYDLNRWKADSNLHRAQVLSMNYIYTLPFFKNSTHSYVRQSLGGWQLSGINTFFTGEPVTIGCGASGYSTGIGTSVMCNTVGPLKIDKGTFDDPTFGPMKTWFNPSVLQQPTLDQYYANGQSGMFGYGGRNNLIGPGRNNWDLALHKDISLPWARGEHSTLQFRLETFNTFNHPQWVYFNAGCNGNFAAGSSPFGRTCGGTQFNSGNGEVNTAWAPRNVQLGMKFLF